MIDQDSPGEIPLNRTRFKEGMKMPVLERPYRIQPGHVQHMLAIFSDAPHNPNRDVLLVAVVSETLFIEPAEAPASNDPKHPSGVRKQRGYRVRRKTILGCIGLEMPMSVVRKSI